MSDIPQDGCVVGVDVGYSRSRRTSAVCLLSWDQGAVDWKIRRFKHLEDDRQAAMASLVEGRDVLVAAFDGPLRQGFDNIGRYRLAEAILTANGIPKLIGKPGQSNSGNGIRLNGAANACARSLLGCAVIGRATHPEAIHELSIVEAFPTSFLGLMVETPESVSVRPPARSDAYFMHLASFGGLDRLLHSLLPGRTARQTWASVTNHDDRAALVCALTALGVAANMYSAVGDADGWIILPDPSFMASWAAPMIAEAKRLRRPAP